VNLPDPLVVIHGAPMLDDRVLNHGLTSFFSQACSLSSGASVNIAEKNAADDLAAQQGMLSSMVTAKN
jgi:hypothetical protein